MEIRRISKTKLGKWLSGQSPSLAMGILFGGDRFSCVDEAVVVEVENDIVGVITIAPRGEQFSGEPTIVGLYVKLEFRGRGFGRALTIAAIERCRKRRLVPVRVDILSTPAKRVIDNLPEEYKKDLKIFDLSGPMGDFSMF